MKPISEEQFWAKAKRDGDCLVWTAYKDRRGYGYICWRRKIYTAHRLAWILANGEIANGLFVCHKCDNPPCINPEHLFLGTHRDNMRDCASKGRNAWQIRPAIGERHGNSRLTDVQVDQIRAAYGKGGVTQKEIAGLYGTTQSYVSEIVLGKKRGRSTNGHALQLIQRALRKGDQ